MVNSFRVESGDELSVKGVLRYHGGRAADHAVAVGNRPEGLPED